MTTTKSKPKPKCKDCLAEGVTTLRPAPWPGPRCETHRRARQKAVRRKNHGRMVENTYGITETEYEAILAVQGGACAICGRAKGITKRLAVDHDHKLGNTREAVRGLLCTTCNHVVIGRYGPEALRRAIDYLADPPARRVLTIELPPLPVARTEDKAPAATEVSA
ncbi:endonuclease VII domain-containing protein [Mycobacteroides abscessus]|uniref:endonuclease VII domain-containing protein n=1 Tax=Mycobacteroides abscessus TaxID=36809 RepID=UPI000E6A84D0|nr:endonuclease VII domain-containing protein [Mycobacteroides abscessus]RIS87425.1 recombination endonuclease VII [Mycobacteroides abscessus]